MPGPLSPIPLKQARWRRRMLLLLLLLPLLKPRLSRRLTT